jgi:hypothetical protein
MTDAEFDEVRTAWAQRFRSLDQDEADDLLNLYIELDQVHFVRDAESGAVRVVLGRKIVRH